MRPYARIEKAGILQTVTKDEFKAMVESLTRKELVNLIMQLSDEVAVLKGVPDLGQSGLGRAD